MKLKNNALQELYETIVNGTFVCSVYASSPIDKAFEECDDCIGNLQNRNDVFEKSNGTLLSANLDLCSKNHDLKNRIKQLEKDHESDVKVIGKLHSQMINLEDEKTEQEKRADILKSQRDMLKKEIEQLKKEKQWLEQSKHAWIKTAVNRGKKLNAAEASNQELKNQLDKANSDRMELQKDRYIWFGKNGEKLAEIAKLKKQLDGLRDIGYEQGQTDLWVKLQDVKDMQPNEFDTECECLGDVIDMDLEDFLDAYKKWQEEKEIDRMRDWLTDFCNERWCPGCPLRGDEFKCGRGYGFDTTNRIPDEDIKKYYEKAHGCGQYTLKDAKLFATTVEGVNRAITKACEGFCEAVKDADIKITENKVCGVKPEEEEPKSNELIVTTRGVITANYSEATMNAIKEAVRKFEKSLPALDSWESTITGSIKVDDILGKTDGTEHEFEYGDAVRVSWGTYDYMYIGSDENHIRLFNPKNHTVVLVSPSEKLTYQGCKIILTDEEDLRKIWKDKK